VIRIERRTLLRRNAPFRPVTNCYRVIIPGEDDQQHTTLDTARAAAKRASTRLALPIRETW